MKNLTTFCLLSLIAIALSFCGKNDRHAHDEMKVQYTCPMDPQIVRDQPGKCPICGMSLVKIDASTDGSIRLNDRQIKLANITTTVVHMENIGENTLLTGKLAVNEDQTEVVSSRVKGRIEKLHFKEIGESVRQGQVLYEIYSEELLTLQQEYLLALRQVEELKEEHYASFLKASERKLLLLGMTSVQITQLAKQKEAGSRISFSSPVSGVVSRIDATEGQYVSEGTPLYRIDRLDPLWAEAELYPGESGLVNVGHIVKVKIGGFENVTVNGKVSFISPEYRSGTQILTLRVIIGNPKQELIPGTQITIVLSHAEKKAIALPVDAVIRDANGSHVWVLENNGAFYSRMVTTGIENEEKVEITNGVLENDKVVVTGAYLLYGELVLKRGGDPMMEHHHGE